LQQLFLGVDGGQSSTTALIGDETGRVLGAGASGPSNHVGAAGGQEKFVHAIEGCVSAACRQAGLDAAAARFEAACLGFSGGPADKELILGQLVNTARLVVTTDALIALEGATAGAPGLIAIAGTGSIAFGRNAAGRTARAGGWGYLFGDEGGAFSIARQALREALRYEEGWGPPTALRQALLEAAGAASANDLLHRLYTTEFPRPRIASYAALVDAVAQQGDTAALEVLREAAGQLAAITLAVRGQLFRPGEAFRAAYVGGVFRSAIVLDEYRRRIGFECAPPIYGPAAGALLEAYRAAGLAPRLAGLPEFKT
jgi:N-acetylglucosamine kinase-like BadF-type ATPase